MRCERVAILSILATVTGCFSYRTAAEIRSTTDVRVRMRPLREFEGIGSEPILQDATEVLPPGVPFGDNDFRRGDVELPHTTHISRSASDIRFACADCDPASITPSVGIVDLRFRAAQPPDRALRRVGGLIAFQDEWVLSGPGPRTVLTGTRARTRVYERDEIQLLTPASNVTHIWALRRVGAGPLLLMLAGGVVSVAGFVAAGAAASQGHSDLAELIVGAAGTAVCAGTVPFFFPGQREVPLADIPTVP